MAQITSYVVDTATSTLGIDWFVDGTTLLDGLAYDFSRVDIVFTGVSSSTVYSAFSSSSQQDTREDIIAAEGGRLPRVLVTLDAVYKLAGHADITRSVYSYEVRLGTPYPPTITHPADISTGSTSDGVNVGALFASPVPGDKVTGWAGRWSTDDGGTWTDTGFNATPDNNPIQDLSLFDGGTFTDEQEVVYQFAWYGVDGAKSPWSLSRWATFYDTPAAPTIVNPVTGFVDYNTIVSLADSPGRDTWQIRRVADIDDAPDESSVLFDTGSRPQVGPVAEPLVFPTPGTTEWVQARQAMHDLWSPWKSIQVFPLYDAPPRPQVGIELGDGVIEIWVLVPTPNETQAAAASARVRARRAGSEDIEWESAAPLDGRVNFPTPASCVEYEFQVDAVSAVGPVTSTGWMK